MSKFFEINRRGKIGFKKLSEADLGVSLSSNQTHIGLFADTLGFVNDAHKTASSKLIYQNTCKELVCLLDFIENPDGSYRSPKIRKGDNDELEIEGLKINSVVREIREIVFQTNSRNIWYLLWFGLENQELVFFLFQDQSKEFLEISSLIPDFENGGRIENSDYYFLPVLNYLEAQTEISSTEYLEELEIIAQTGEMPLKIIKPRFFDIEKAKNNFAITGRKGEELVAEYLDRLKSGNMIANFNWVNNSRESGFPYDFEIDNLNGSNIFTDVKTTSYTFNQGMIFSNGELNFINQNLNYHVYRVFDLKEENPSLKICENINVLSKRIGSVISIFENEILKNETKLNSMKLSINPSNKDLIFSEKIQLL